MDSQPVSTRAPRMSLPLRMSSIHSGETSAKLTGMEPTRCGAVMRQPAMFSLLKDVVVGRRARRVRTSPITATTARTRMMRTRGLNELERCPEDEEAADEEPGEKIEKER